MSKKPITSTHAEVTLDLNGALDFLVYDRELDLDYNRPLLNKALTKLMCHIIYADSTKTSSSSTVVFCGEGGSGKSTYNEACGNPISSDITVVLFKPEKAYVVAPLERSESGKTRPRLAYEIGKMFYILIRASDHDPALLENPSKEIIDESWKTVNDPYNIIGPLELKSLFEKRGIYLQYFISPERKVDECVKFIKEHL